MSRRLASYEQETIITFNKDEDVAHIFTYERTWQKHLEGKLGLKSVLDNGFGGREYQLPKSMIKRPRGPRRLSDSAKRKLTERLCQNRFLGAQSLIPVGKQTTETQHSGKHSMPTYPEHSNAKIAPEF